MSYSLKEISKSKDILNFIKHNIIRLMKLNNKIHKLNRNCYGINRDIENLIHISREKLNEGFLWLDKAFYQLKRNIKEKEKHNNKLTKLGYNISE